MGLWKQIGEQNKCRIYPILASGKPVVIYYLSAHACSLVVLHEPTTKKPQDVGAKGGDITCFVAMADSKKIQQTQKIILEDSVEEQLIIDIVDK